MIIGRELQNSLNLKPVAAMRMSTTTARLKMSVFRRKNRKRHFQCPILYNCPRCSELMLQKVFDENCYEYNLVSYPIYLLHWAFCVTKRVSWNIIQYFIQLLLHSITLLLPQTARYICGDFAIW